MEVFYPAGNSTRKSLQNRSGIFWLVNSFVLKFVFRGFCHQEINTFCLTLIPVSQLRWLVFVSIYHCNLISVFSKAGGDDTWEECFHYEIFSKNICLFTYVTGREKMTGRETHTQTETERESAREREHLAPGPFLRLLQHPGFCQVEPRNSFPFSHVC